MAHRAVINQPGGGRAIRNRVGVVETVFFQGMNSEAESYVNRYHLWLDTSEEPYKHTFNLGPEWKPINTAHLSELSYLVIENVTGDELTTNPTPEELDDINSRIIQVSFMVPVEQEAQATDRKKRTMHDPPLAKTSTVQQVAMIPHLLIRPGEDNRISPPDASLIAVRCASGVARCRIRAYPR